MKPKYLVTAVLVAIASFHAWNGLVVGELPQFHLVISGLALVLAVAVSVSRVGSAGRSAPRRSRTPGQRRVGGLLAVSGVVGAIVWVAAGPWMPAADFDVTGLLFVIQNVWQLAVLGVLIVVASTGVVVAWPPSQPER